MALKIAFASLVLAALAGCGGGSTSVSVDGVPEPSRRTFIFWSGSSGGERVVDLGTHNVVLWEWLPGSEPDPEGVELWVDDDGPHLRYRTPMSAARRRIAKAVSVLRKAMGDSEVTASVEALARWLEEFHPHSLVELDYGGVARLPGAEALEEDHSAEDIASILRCMADGEVDTAGELYQALTDRWRTVHIAERGN